MKTVLITGASGFFGKSVLRALKAGDEQDRYICIGHRHVLDRDDSRFEWVQTDLLKKDAICHLIETYQPTHIIHLAWFVEHGAFWHASLNVDWLWATTQLFDAFLKHGGRHFIGAGTLFEHDLCASPLNEDAPIAPKTLYGEAKASTYRLLQQRLKQHSSEITFQWLRIGYFFGEEEPPQKFLSRAVRQMIMGETIKTLARYAVRDYGHVDGLGHIVTAFLECRESGAFLVSGGSTLTIEDILTRMASCLAYTKPILYSAFTPPACEPNVIAPDLSKMTRALSFDLLRLSRAATFDKFFLDKKRM